MLLKRKLGLSDEGHKLNKLYTRKKYIRNKEGLCYYGETCFAWWRGNKFCYVPD